VTTVLVKTVVLYMGTLVNSELCVFALQPRMVRIGRCLFDKFLANNIIFG